MKIYTKKGDQGETGLFGGSRVSKDHARILAYGTLDEFGAALGLALSTDGMGTPLPQSLIEKLVRIEGEIFQLGAELATPSDKKTSVPLVSENEIITLEKEIDQMEKEIPELKNFILPGGTSRSCALHVARTIIRRAERELVSLSKTETLRPEVIQYANRLSDYLFVCARWANHQAGGKELIWKGP